MVQMIDDTSRAASTIEVVAYDAEGGIMVTINVGGVTVARIKLPAASSAGDMVGHVVAEVAVSWPAQRGG